MLKSFYIEILGIDFKIGLYKNEKCVGRALRKYAKKYKVEDESEFKDSPAGVVFHTKNTSPFGVYIMYSIEHLTTELVAHECWHGTKLAMKLLGINKREDSEFSAILNGYINQKVTNYIKKKGLRIG